MNEPDFRTLLQEELLKRCRANPRYSLRAFARSLGTHPASLSHVMRGRRPLTGHAIRQMGARLGLSPDRIQDLERSNRDPEAKKDAFQTLAQDLFEVVSDWYHDAILELTRVKHFEADPRWIARTLAITPSEVHIAVERLTRLGLLEITPTGQWIDRSELNAVTGGPHTSIARMKLQRQLLERSIQALENDPYDLRDHSSLTMAMQTSDLPEAKERIRKFRRELCAYLQRPGTSPDQVYQLAVGLFALSRTGEPSHES